MNYSWSKDENGYFVVRDDFYSELTGHEVLRMKNVAVHRIKVDRRTFLNRSMCYQLKVNWCRKHGYNEKDYIVHHDTDGYYLSIVPKEFHNSHTHYGGYYLAKKGYI